MSDFTTKRLQALEACDKVISGIEDETITVSSALLQCMKIARLVNDIEGQEWLSYEYGGYPETKDGLIVESAWEIAIQHGRGFISDEDKKQHIFIALAAVLEESIESSRTALKNYSTQGFSASGEYALLATDRMNLRVAQQTNKLLEIIQTNEKRLSILRSQYYDYAIRWKIDLQFGNTARNFFEEYQEKVSLFFASFPTTTLQKLNALEDLIEDGNPERYSQALTSCRRLWEDVAKQLFDEFLPDYKDKIFKAKSGVKIDVSGDHYNNKLSAAIETLQSKAAKNTLVGSEIIYLVDWMDLILKLQSSGVHSDITRDQAVQCIIHTYIALGDILKLRDAAVSPNLE